jgi:hypothetical protein
MASSEPVALSVEDEPRVQHDGQLSASKELQAKQLCCGKALTGGTALGKLADAYTITTAKPWDAGRISQYHNK